MANGWTSFAVRGALALLLVATFREPTSMAKDEKKQDKSPSSTSFTITSPGFKEMGEMPKKYTCEGSDTSPPLEWSGAPSSTKSFALIVDDPDAPDPAKPQRVWVHWVLYAIPPTTTKLAEGASTSGLPEGTKVGKNDWSKTTYGSPCPPIGRHRYFHKIYALDKVLEFPSSPTKAEVESAMKGHVLAHAELVGTYQKGRR